jgi:hypothetical protein
LRLLARTLLNTLLSTRQAGKREVAWFANLWVSGNPFLLHLPAGLDG